MKTIHRIMLLTAAILASATIQLKAQVSDDGNILPNGDFEIWEYGALDGWYAPTSLSPDESSETRPGSKGRKSLKILLNDDKIDTKTFLPVKAGQKYKLSFWHKGNINYNKISVVFLYHDGTKIVSRPEVLSSDTEKNEWVEAKKTITIPNDIVKVKVRIQLKSAYMGELLLDDIELIPEGGGVTPDPEVPVLEAPKGLTIVPHQGEMEISWNKSNDPEVKWEILVDEKDEATVTQNSYIKTRLTPGTTHNVKVRAVKGTATSPYAEKSGTTQRMSKDADSPERVPYIRTISPDGNCDGLSLKLYYNDLANPNATITYKLNGKTVVPKNDTLEIPPFDGFYKQYRLEIHVNEGDGKEWEIQYLQLGVRKPNPRQH